MLLGAVAGIFVVGQSGSASHCESWQCLLIFCSAMIMGGIFGWLEWRIIKSEGLSWTAGFIGGIIGGFGCELLFFYFLI